MKNYNDIIDLLEKYMSREAMQYLIDTDNKENFYYRFYNSMVGKKALTIKKNAKQITVNRLQDIYC